MSNEQPLQKLETQHQETMTNRSYLLRMALSASRGIDLVIKQMRENESRRKESRDQGKEPRRKESKDQSNEPKRKESRDQSNDPRRNESKDQSG